jgi:hypothetical protein
MVLMGGAWERFSLSTCGKAFECGKCGSEISVAKIEVSFSLRLAFVIFENVFVLFAAI